MKRYLNAICLIFCGFLAGCEGEDNCIPSGNRLQSTDMSQLGDQNYDDQDYRVYYGDDVSEGKYPWIVKINGCTASVIAPKWVLTAAHCYGYSATRNSKGTLEGVTITSGPVRYGSVDLDSKQLKSAQVKKVYLHPEYIKLTKDEVWGKEPYDVALLELNEPIVLPLYLQLPFRDPIAGENIILAGWGRTESGTPRVLQKSTLQVKPHSSCFNGDAKRFCSTGSVCDPSSNVGSGDSGGPVFVRDGFGYMVLGINSTSNGDNGKPHATHAQVYTFVPWIKSITSLMN